MAGFNLVAIITRTKDRPLLLRRALLSVKDQSYSNYLHIIINDGGAQEEIVRLIGEVASKAIVRTINSGGHMEATSNAGLEIAKERKADLIIIHDDDDSWSPEFLSIMVQELQMYENLVPSVKGIICRTNLVYERIEGNVIIIDHLESSPHKPPFPEVGILRFSELLDSYHNFSPIQFLYRAEVLDVVGMYDPLFKVLGDWEFNLRFLQHFDIALIPNHLAFYHQRVSAIGADLNSLHEVERKVQWESYRQCIHNKYLREGSAMGLLMNFPIDRILTQLSSLQARVAELEGNTKKGKKHAK